MKLLILHNQVLDNVDFETIVICLISYNHTFIWPQSCVARSISLGHLFSIWISLQLVYPSTVPFGFSRRARPLTSLPYCEGFFVRILLRTLLIRVMRTGFRKILKTRKNVAHTGRKRNEKHWNTPAHFEHSVQNVRQNMPNRIRTERPSDAILFPC